MRWQLFVLAAGLAECGALAAQPATTTLDAVARIQQVDKTSQTEDVQFRTGPDNRLTVPVRVAGNGPYRFLVDTGADRTAVSRELAGQLRLVGGNQASLISVTGVSTVSTADIPGLQSPAPCIVAWWLASKRCSAAVSSTEWKRSSLSP